MKAFWPSPWKLRTERKVDARALGARPEDPAYLIYTSGSTGTPKGIVISGRNICHYLRAANEVYGVEASDVVFQGASVAFDLSMEEIWLPYLVGAGLFVATAEMIGEADKLPGLMEANRVTVLDTVPTLLALLPRDIASLRLIILGGEACPPAIANRWCRPSRKIFNSYGPTETTVVATVAEVRPGTPVTIGRPIPNYTCYVAGEHLDLLPPGIEGELLIGGPGVAKGYLRRDRLTREKFIANPFLTNPTWMTRPIRFCTGPAMRWRSPRTARSCSMAGSTIRSRFAAFASNWAKSKQSSPVSLALRMPPPCCATIMTLNSSWRSWSLPWTPKSTEEFCATNCGKACLPTWSRNGSSSSKACRNSPPARSTARV